MPPGAAAEACVVEIWALHLHELWFRRPTGGTRLHGTRRGARWHVVATDQPLKARRPPAPWLGSTRRANQRRVYYQWPRRRRRAWSKS